MIKVSLFYFIVLFIIFLYYILFIQTNSINKYPTINNMSKTIYKDDKGTCYKYEKKEIDCSK